MKNLLTSDIGIGVRYPFEKKSIEFLYKSNKEMIATLAQSLGGSFDGTSAYVLYGLEKTFISGSDYSFTKGAVYDSVTEEVYLFDAVASVEILLEPILNFSETFPGAYNPVKFSDLNNKYPHQEEKLIISSGALGSGSFNYEDLLFVHNGWIERNVLTDVTPAGGGTITVLSANIKYMKRGKTLTMIFTASGSITSTNVLSLTFVLPSANLDSGFTYRDTCSVGTNVTAPTSDSGRMTIVSGAGQMNILPHWNWANDQWPVGTFEIGGQLTIPIL